MPKAEVERLARLTQSDVGTTEENVKLKIMVPLLEVLGHKREDLDFERRTRTGGKIDIFIKLPSHSSIIVDTKFYNDDLGNLAHQDQLHKYLTEGALLAVLANGLEIRIYTQIRGWPLEDSLLYCIKRQNLTDSKVWDTLAAVLSKEQLLSSGARDVVGQREKEIVDARRQVKATEAEFEQRIDECDVNTKRIEKTIEQQRQELDALSQEREHLEREKEAAVVQIHEEFGLPVKLWSEELRPPLVGARRVRGTTSKGKAPPVSFSELEAADLIKDGQILYFIHANDEQACVVVAQNELQYKGKLYSKSRLARKLDVKHGYADCPKQGPDFWMTEDGRRLRDLENRVREGGC